MSDRRAEPFHSRTFRSYSAVLALQKGQKSNLDRGQTVAEVAQLLRVTRQRVYNWASAFAACPQPTVLQDHYGIGRPSAWTEDLRALLLASLEKHPDELGYAAVNWTVPLLQEHLERSGGTAIAG